jgi:hypothetical protein
LRATDNHLVSGRGDEINIIQFALVGAVRLDPNFLADRLIDVRQKHWLAATIVAAYLIGAQGLEHIKIGSKPNYYRKGKAAINFEY